MQHSNLATFSRQLRARRERCRSSCAAEERNELAPLHRAEPNPMIMASIADQGRACSKSGRLMSLPVRTPELLPSPKGSSPRRVAVVGRNKRSALRRSYRPKFTDLPEFACRVFRKCSGRYIAIQCARGLQAPARPVRRRNALRLLRPTGTEHRRGGIHIGF